MKDKVKLESVDLVCRIASIDINGKTSEVDFDIIGSDVLVTPESMSRVPVKTSAAFVASWIEKLIRKDHAFQREYC